MIVGILQIQLYLPGSHSLKNKRMHISSLCSRIRKKFNTSVAELDFLNNRENALLGITHISNSSSLTNKVMSNILNFIEKSREMEIIDHQLEVI